MSQAQKVIGAVEKRVRTHKAPDLVTAIKQSYFLAGKNEIPTEGEAEYVCLDGSKVKLSVVRGEYVLTVA